MCGLSGFVGIKDQNARAALVESLGIGIDTRGGHASGYVSVNRKSGNIFHAKRVGTWLESKRKFRRRVSIGDMSIMHARWATCGEKNAQDQAHPFEIKRGGKTKLFGAHNGCIWNAKESAKANGRGYSVDSRELFELMADGDVEGIQELNGYGVITWYVPGEDHINMVRLSSSSEICVVQLKGGGVAWASTWEILGDALEFAELQAEAEYAVPEIGTIYQFKDKGVYRTDVSGIMFDSKIIEDAPESWESQLIAQWEEEQSEKEKLEMYLELMRSCEGDNDTRDVPMMDHALRTSWERDQEEWESEEEERDIPNISAMYR